MRISIGASASATVDLQPGWRVYDAHVDGAVPGGVTTVVLRPAGSRRPGGIGGEGRPLSVAVDAVAFGPGDLAGNRGVWPVATSQGPALFVGDDSGGRIVVRADDAIVRVPEESSNPR
jgi:hypothetical protein